MIKLQSNIKYGEILHNQNSEIQIINLKIDIIIIMSKTKENIFTSVALFTHIYSSQINRKDNIKSIARNSAWK